MVPVYGLNIQFKSGPSHDMYYPVGSVGNVVGMGILQLFD